mgnify:CR=1 FL=1
MTPSSRGTLIFDLDGTLVETDPTHLAAFNDILTANGVPPVDQHYYNTHIIGFQNAEIFGRLFPDLTEDDHRRLADPARLRAAVLVNCRLPQSSATHYWR